MTSPYERNAISDEYRNDANDELVDRLRIKKRGDDFTAAHQPDIFALAFSKSLHVHANCLVCEFDGRWSIFWTRMMREDDGSTLGIELCSHAQTRVVGLPAEHFRIDRVHEMRRSRKNLLVLGERSAIRGPRPSVRYIHQRSSRCGR